MGVIINKVVDSATGAQFEAGYYIRLQVDLNAAGDSVIVKIFDYVNKQAFNDRKSTLAPVWLDAVKLDYNRETDGVDLLLFAHEKIAATLAEVLGHNDFVIDL
jgi:hypothetical protein